MADQELYISDLPDSVTTVARPPGGSRAPTAVPARRHGTSLAVGEEDAPTTLAVGEEGDYDDEPTTLAVGEEGDYDEPTTLAVGEEGEEGPTTLAIGEEGDDDY